MSKPSCFISTAYPPFISLISSSLPFRPPRLCAVYWSLLATGLHSFLFYKSTPPSVMGYIFWCVSGDVVFTQKPTRKFLSNRLDEAHVRANRYWLLRYQFLPAVTDKIATEIFGNRYFLCGPSGAAYVRESHSWGVSPCGGGLENLHHTCASR
jgi:hypothetical protein